MYIVFLISYN